MINWCSTNPSTNWYKYQQICDEIKRYSAYIDTSYSLPEDRRQMMADFYMASLISNDKHNFRDPDLAEGMAYLQKSLLKQMKKRLLDDVFLIICCEMRHAESENHELYDNKELNSQYQAYYKNYNDEIINSNNKNEYDPINTRGNNSHYDMSYYGALKTIKESFGGDPAKFVEMAMDIFSLGEWEEDYGGEAWANICDAWLQLYNAKEDGEAIAYIDHIIDLEHNTSTLFNKLKDYRIKGNYKWIKSFLDMKSSKEADAYHLMVFCSPSMKRIAKRVLFDVEHKTEEGGMAPVADYWEKIIEGMMDDGRKIELPPQDVVPYLNWQNVKNHIIERVNTDTSRRYDAAAICEFPQFIKGLFSHDEIRALLLRIVERFPESMATDSRYLEQYFTEKEIIPIVLKGVVYNPFSYWTISEDIRRMIPVPLVVKTFEEYVDKHRDDWYWDRYKGKIIEMLPNDFVNVCFARDYNSNGHPLYQVPLELIVKLTPNVLYDAVVKHCAADYTFPFMMRQYLPNQMYADLLAKCGVKVKENSNLEPIF